MSTHRTSLKPWTSEDARRAHMPTRRLVIHGTAPSYNKSEEQRAKSLAVLLSMMSGDRRDYEIIRAALAKEQA